MGDTSKVIVFVFAGRQANMRLQIRCIEPILAAHPNVEYHVWNLARHKQDDRYLHKLQPSSDRMIVRHEYSGVRPWRDNLGKVWQHYTDQAYKDCLFVKIDDDIVFLESRRFGAYVEAINTNRGSVVSASVINNGACTRTEPGLWSRWEPRGRSLLEVHQHKVFAEMAHRYFFDNWESLMGVPVSVAPTEDWLSINAIGFDWPTLCEVVERIGKPSPREISGRGFPASQLIGDEGAVNMGPRMIMRGFMTAHLAFGPQLCTEQQMSNWRRVYDRVGAEYLAMRAAA